MPPTASPRGFSLFELLSVLVIVALLLSLALPSFSGAVAGIRVRAALNQITGELYRARMAAVETGTPVRLVLRSEPDGCVAGLELQLDPSGAPTPLGWGEDLSGLCVGHSGDSVLVFNARGMLRPPARSIYAVHGGVADTVLISIAGRVRRSYRRRPRG